MGDWATEEYTGKYGKEILAAFTDENLTKTVDFGEALW